MRLIIDVLREARKGAAVEEASEALADVVQAVDATGKAGSVTIKITVKPSKLRDAEKTLAIAVDASVPRADIPDSLFFSNVDGDLLRDDPRQVEMKFAQVDTKRA